MVLQRSYCVFHRDRVGSHARVEFKSFHNSAVSDRQRHTETVASCLPQVTSRHGHQRVPHSFRQQPTSSIRREIRQRAPRVQQTRNKQDTGSNSAPLPRLPCICSVSCAQLSFTLEPDNGLCNTHDECACESSLSMSRLVYRLKASAV